MKPVKLKNIFTGEIVICKDLNDITETNGVEFVRVFREENSERTFLVKKDAFEVI